MRSYSLTWSCCLNEIEMLKDIAIILWNFSCWLDDIWARFQSIDSFFLIDRLTENDRRWNIKALSRDVQRLSIIIRLRTLNLDQKWWFLTILSSLIRVLKIRLMLIVSSFRWYFQKLVSIALKICMSRTWRYHILLCSKELEWSRLLSYEKERSM